MTVTYANGVRREYRYTTFDPLTGMFTFNPALGAADPPPNFADAVGVGFGQTNDFKGIPYFKHRLDTLARTLVAAYNWGQRPDGAPIDVPFNIIGHVDGFDLNGNAGQLLWNFAQVADIDWNDPAVFNINDVRANNLVLNPNIMRNPALLATRTDPTGGESMNDVTLSWINIRDDRGLFREGRLHDFISGITGEIGIVGMQAARFERNHGELLVTIDNQRRSISGVSLNEETAFMIQHQMVFNAAARLVSIIDGLYDTTINRMGNW
jgi:flagellar hook-associated protein 1 FlgK